MDSPFIRLVCAVQTNAYGKKGSTSCVARFAATALKNNFLIDENQPYAEMWIGDHPSSSSEDLNGTTLQALMESDPVSYLGKFVYEHFNFQSHLPFLFKILSFDKALPLQVHFDGSQPNTVGVGNKGRLQESVNVSHKPLVAVVISDTFEGFIGFRPLDEIKVLLKSVPELRQAVSQYESLGRFVNSEASLDSAETEQLLKEVFLELLSSSQDIIRAASNQLIDRVKRAGLGLRLPRPEMSKLIESCLTKHPEDVGVFAAVFFMNYVKLEKGECIVIPANVIHAFLEGDVIEALVWSDRTIACGFQDAEDRIDARIFVNMLSYSVVEPGQLILKPKVWEKSETGCTQVFHTPMDELDLMNIYLEQGHEELLGAIQGPAIFLVTKGIVSLTSNGVEEEKLVQGQVVFVKPGTATRWTAGEYPAEIWCTLVEV